MNSSSDRACIALSGVSNSFSPMVLASDESTNDEDCHGSAGTPLGTHAIGQDSGLEESREAIRT
jgi:hypothetical protein